MFTLLKLLNNNYLIIDSRIFPVQDLLDLPFSLCSVKLLIYLTYSELIYLACAVFHSHTIIYNYDMRHAIINVIVILFDFLNVIYQHKCHGNVIYQQII